MSGTNYTVKFIDSASSFFDFFLIYGWNPVTSLKTSRSRQCAAHDAALR